MMTLSLTVLSSYIFSPILFRRRGTIKSNSLNLVMFLLKIWAQYLVPLKDFCSVSEDWQMYSLTLGLVCKNDHTHENRLRWNTDSLKTF